MILKKYTLQRSEKSRKQQTTQKLESFCQQRFFDTFDWIDILRLLNTIYEVNLENILYCEFPPLDFRLLTQNLRILT